MWLGNRTIGINLVGFCCIFKIFQCCVSISTPLNVAPVLESAFYFIWLANPDATYTELAQTAGVLGTPITRQAIEQRFTPEAAATLKITLEAAVAELISADPQTLPLLKQFNGVTYKTALGFPFPTNLLTLGKGGIKRTTRTKLR
ncbi:MAG: hypothetical protein OXU23_16490 [Candidatus Poribacteria bacterium]|nr:hypothetical protein [Candidatus Poribacteria bacterium]